MSSVAHIIRRRRARKARQRTQRQRSTIWMLLIFVVMLFVVVVPMVVILGVAGMLYIQATNAMPSPAETIYLDPIIGATELYDRTGGTLIYIVEDPLGNQRRWIELEALPDYVVSATLLMEDPDYLQTANFDVFQTLNLLWRYILDVPVASDRSITGRLVRNAVLPLARKSGLDDPLLEIALVAEAERQLSPRDLLEWHLNTNYYGNDAYGIDAAAQVYLGKSAEDLTLDETALLVAIPLAPRFNPFDNTVASNGRQADLLLNMFNHALINKPQFDQASVVVTQLRSDFIQKPLLAPEFSIYARQQTQDILDNLGLDGARMVARSGLKITTTLDIDLYVQSDCVLRAHIDRLNGGLGNVLAQDNSPCRATDYLVQPFGVDATASPDSGTLMLMDVPTGEIYSIVGDARTQKYQPGVILHPFVYFEGFLQRLFTPASMVYDVPRAFPGPADGLIYTPSNPDGRFRGPLNLRDAMTAGLIPPAVHVADSRGIKPVIRTSHLMGINSIDENSYNLDILTRSGNVSVLDTTYAYSVFASMGIMRGVNVEPIAQGYRGRNPVAILQITDAEGNVLWSYNDERRQLSQTIIFEPSLGYLVNDILSDDITRQRVLDTQDEVLQLTRPSAVVNGLSADKRDNWTVGYTPNIVLGVHLGRVDNGNMSLDNYGRQGSAPIWRALMNYVHDRNGLPPDGWQRPTDIEEYVVCDISGLIPSDEGSCPTRQEIVPPGSPLLTDTHWQSYEVNTQTGQLATANTPTNLRSAQVYFVPPHDILEWWTESGQPLPPTDYDTISRPEVLKAVQILQPADFAYVGGIMDIRGSIDDPNIDYFQLTYGQDVNPHDWFEIGGQQHDYAVGTSLGTWNTAGLNGVYTLQFTVVFTDGSIDTDTKLVTLDNTAPNLNLLTGDGVTTIRYPAQTVISLLADASDNLTIDRVEFYQNGELLGIDTEWPYGFEHDITSVGTEVFSAVVFDQVGNNSQSDLTVEIVRSG
jgi:membrane peptidoglycan carboxypeptidase